MKKLIMLLILLVLCSLSVMALDACDSETPLDDVPCLIFLPINASLDTCDTINAEVHFNGSYLRNTTLINFTNFACSFEFNDSVLGPYNIYYSTGDTGVLTVKEGNVLINLFWFGLVLAIGLMVLGIHLENHPMVAITGFLELIMGLWIFINGFSIYNNFVTSMIATILIAVGGYYLTMSTMAMIEQGYVTDDAYG